VAFADHENTGGDDEGSLAVIDLDGHEKKLASGLFRSKGSCGQEPAMSFVYRHSYRQRGKSSRSDAGGQGATITNVPEACGCKMRAMD